MTSTNHSDPPPATGTNNFWSALQVYQEYAQTMCDSFQKAITKSRNKEAGAPEVGDPTFAFYLDGEKMFTDALLFSKTLTSHRPRIDQWLQEAGRNQGLAREKYTIADLDWNCLMWQFAPAFLNANLPDKSKVEAALHATLDLIAVGRVMTVRTQYLPAGHVEVGVASFAGSRKKTQLSTRVAHHMCALSLYCFVQY